MTSALRLTQILATGLMNLARDNTSRIGDLAVMASFVALGYALVSFASVRF